MFFEWILKAQSYKGGMNFRQFIGQFIGDTHQPFVTLTRAKHFSFQN